MSDLSVEPDAASDCPKCHGASTVDPDPDCDVCGGEGEVFAASRCDFAMRSGARCRLSANHVGPHDPYGILAPCSRCGGDGYIEAFNDDHSDVVITLCTDCGPAPGEFDG